MENLNKLTPAELESIKDDDFTEKDIPQIEEAMRRTKYEYNGRKIKRSDAVRLLGRKIWLSGITRSAFHASAVRPTLDGKSFVYFDTSCIFKQ